MAILRRRGTPHTGVRMSASGPIVMSSVVSMPSSATSMPAAGPCTATAGTTRITAFTGVDPAYRAPAYRARETSPRQLAGRACATHFSEASFKPTEILGALAMTDRGSDIPPAPAQAVSPTGINHLVLNVRDLGESHRFWTEIVGFKQVAALRSRPDRSNVPKM